MCGIAGYFGKKNITKNLLDSSLNCLINRGPDGCENLYIKISKKINLNLIFTRLAIIDLNNRAMQPMYYKNYILLLNGEIYNYKFLRESIETTYGPQIWESTGDVEVALRYIYFNGIKGIKDFDGMFSIALFDKEKESLYLARDYFGEKPLYILQNEDGIYFGSEPKAIWALQGKQNNINYNKIINFLVNGYKSLFKDNEDFFEGLERVDPGFIETFNLNNSVNRKKESYNPKKQIKAINQKSIPRSDIVNNVRRIVKDAVRKRLESDVPIAICLSGGVDSSLLAAIAKRDFGISLSAYTLVSLDSRYSEAESASRIAKHLGLNHVLVNIDPNEFFVRLKKLTNYHESPISTISYYVQSYLMEKIHQDGFKVSLMGTGADEIFSGYYDHHLLYLAEMYSKNKSVYQEAQTAWRQKILPQVRNPLYRDDRLYITEPNYREHIYEGSNEMQKISKIKSQTLFKEKNLTNSLLRNRMLNELFFEVTPVILHEDDRNSMMHSVENRSPYLSYELLKYMLSIMDEQLIHDGLTKSILREAFEDYLPKDLLMSAKKIGFNASLAELCDLSSLEFQSFMGNNSSFWEIVNKTEAIKILSKLGESDFYNKASFNIISAKMFHDQFSLK
jgi:asparagine synthase (glutamine-hydrolysing)